MIPEGTLYLSRGRVCSVHDGPWNGQRVDAPCPDCNAIDGGPRRWHVPDRAVGCVWNGTTFESCDLPAHLSISGRWLAWRCVSGPRPRA